MKIIIEPEKNDTFKTKVFENVYEASVVGSRLVQGQATAGGLSVETFPTPFRHLHTQMDPKSGRERVGDLIELVHGAEEKLRDLKSGGPH